MHLPILSRALFTLSALGMAIGAHAADMSASHIYNDAWTSHAKFHTGHTLAFAITLALLTLFFAWRRSGDARTNVLAASGFGSVYWIAQSAAIFYPGTAYFDREFVTPASYVLGVPAQVCIQIVFLGLIGLATVLALRSISAGPQQSLARKV